MLRNRTGYSFGAAFGRVPQVAKLASVIASDAELAGIAIADRGSTFGFREWERECKELEVKPVYGVELAVSLNPIASKPVICHWTFIAKDSVESVNRLVQLATSQMKYEPTLTYAQAANAEGVFKIAGKNIPLALLNDDAFRDLLASKDDLYCELSPGVNSHYFRNISSLIPPALLYDNQYPGRGDQDCYEIIAGRRANRRLNEQFIPDLDTLLEGCDRSIINDQSQIEKALANSQDILKASSATLQSTELVKPHSVEPLESLAWNRLRERFEKTADYPEYRERLSYELKIINQKKFMDYFQIVHDIIRFADDNQIPIGPGRGSSGGSLFCYLLGITQVDPLKYDLLFSRFIDLNRTDWPDIDMDFPDDFRPKIIEYLQGKYGKDTVAKLGTIAYYRARSSLKEVAKQCGGIGIQEEDDIATEIALSLADEGIKPDSIGEETIEKLQKSYASMKYQINLVQRVYGHPRHASQHASAVILSRKPVSQIAAINSQNQSLQIEMDDSEAAGLLKVDVLGLIQLTIFSEVFDAVSHVTSMRDIIAKLERDIADNYRDLAIYNMLNEGRTCGIFQFSGKAVKGLASRVEITSFDDICAISALARPGPLQSGFADEWVRQKNRKEPKPVGIKAIQESGILKDTLNVLAYQEQVMRICREIGGMEWPEVIAVRKIIGKSKGSEQLEKHRKAFIDGASNPVGANLSADEANRLWDAIAKYGKYSFNKSHSVAYSMITYASLYLKAYFPRQYAAAVLNHMKTTEEKLEYLKELDREGIKYVAFNKSVSTDKWIVDDENLIGPLSNARGIGPSYMKRILEDRRLGKPHAPGLKKRLDNPIVELASISPIADELARVCPDLKERNIHSVPVPVEEWNERDYSSDYDELAVGKVRGVSIKDQNSTEKVKRRGGKYDGFPYYFSFKLKDDTGEIYCRIQPKNPMEFERCKLKLKEGAFYAIRGTLFVMDGTDFRMITAERYRFLGRQA